MSTQTRLKSRFKEKLHLGPLLSGKTALRSVAALLAIITLGGFLASNTHSIDAQQQDVVVQAVAVGGIIPVIVGEFDTAVLGTSGIIGIAYNTNVNKYAIVDNQADEVYIVEQGTLLDQFDTSGFSTDPQGIAFVPPPLLTPSLGLNVSNCEGPPFIQRTITFFAVPPSCGMSASRGFWFRAAYPRKPPAAVRKLRRERANPQEQSLCLFMISG